MASKNMKRMNIIAIILIIVCILVLLPCMYVIKEKFINREKNDSEDNNENTAKDIFDTRLSKDISNSYMDSQIIKNTIPKVIIQVNTNENKISDEIYKNIKQYAPTYQHVVYDIRQCKKFLQKEYGNDYVKLFEKLNTDSHKIDLFKYCYLYKHGGIYLNADVEIIRPLNQIFNKNYLYVILSKDDKSIYKGVVVSPPKNPIFLDLIQYIFTTCNNKSTVLYEHIYARNFYKLLTNGIKIYPIVGLNKINEFNYVYLFEEHSETSKKNNNGIYNSFVNDFNLPIMKIKYSNFPWY